MKEAELENKRWYRIYKTIALFVVGVAFLAPGLMRGFSGGSLLDGIISAAIWAVIVVVFKKILIYIIYDPKKAE